MKPVSTYPKIVAVLACDDHGPCDPEPSAICPHCGAGGRYVFTFLCEDGTRRGAMKGCIQLFPRSVAAVECEKALIKARTGKPSRWDDRMLRAIEALENGHSDIRQLEAVALQIKNEKRAWMRQKGYIR